ncbi:hypothetical protein VTN31DRAFT_171 [Thermomyces dupontii]|uniref:uncharacterized protein n=1 Tax=Talaromyces thermophilus TaxID=28565 RepID=UPI0037446762
MVESDVKYPAVNAAGHAVDNVAAEASKTSEEFRDLKNKTSPAQTTSTGQPLTHYHSLLYSLLSWEQPRATAISFAGVVTFILAARYLPLLRWFFKFLYLTLGSTAVLEIAGRVVFGQGFTSKFLRPRKYYTIPRETIESILEDIGQLFDFLLIEFQRTLFAENIAYTVSMFTAALLSYWLIKILPLWGLALLAVFVAYLGPLIYISNREIVDEQIAEIQKLIDAQTSQARELANQYASQASGAVKGYANDYTSKAQDYIRRSASPVAARIKKEPSPEPPSAAPAKEQPEQPATEPVFPNVPKTEPVEPAAAAEPVPESVESAQETLL